MWTAWEIYYAFAWCYFLSKNFMWYHAFVFFILISFLSLFESFTWLGTKDPRDKFKITLEVLCKDNQNVFPKLFNFMVFGFLLICNYIWSSQEYLTCQYFQMNLSRGILECLAIAPQFHFAYYTYWWGLSLLKKKIQLTWYFNSTFILLSEIQKANFLHIIWFLPNECS